MSAADNVVPFGGATVLPVPVEKVLNAALEHELEEVIVVGRESGGEFYIATSVSSRTLGDALYLLEAAKHLLVRDSLESDDGRIMRGV